MEEIVKRGQYEKKVRILGGEKVVAVIVECKHAIVRKSEKKLKIKQKKEREKK